MTGVDIIFLTDFSWDDQSLSSRLFHHLVVSLFQEMAVPLASGVFRLFFHYVLSCFGAQTHECCLSQVSFRGYLSLQAVAVSSLICICVFDCVRRLRLFSGSSDVQYLMFLS